MEREEREQGPSLGLRLRHEVRGFAIEERSKWRDYPGWVWNEVLQLTNSELGEVIGEANHPDVARGMAAAWLLGPRDLQERRT